MNGEFRFCEGEGVGGGCEAKNIPLVEEAEAGEKGDRGVSDDLIRFCGGVEGIYVGGGPVLSITGDRI